MAEQEVPVVAASDPTEPKVTPEVSAPAVAEKVGEEQEPQGTEPEGELDEHGKKRKGGWQRKIERLETEREFLMQELLKRRSSEPEPKAEPVEPSVVAKAEPKPEDFALGDGTYDIVKFNKAHVDWLWDQKESQRTAKTQAESAKSEEQKLREKWNKQIEEAHAKYPDMEDALAVPVLPNDPKKNAFVQKELMRSPNAGDLAHWLGTHPEEARKIMDGSETDIVRAFGRIEAQFAREESAETEKPKEAPVPPVTQAPKPATPIKKTSAAGGPIDPRSPESDKISPEEWLRLRRAQLKGK